METLYTIAIFVGLIVSIAVPYWLKAANRKREALKTWEKNVRAGTVQPVTLHPKIDVLKCIGCAACVRACPEGVLGVVDGIATILSGTKCIGHGLCADACPVSGITLGFGAPKQGQEIPFYNENYETNIPGLYIVGELGGIGLIKNAVGQGVKAIDDVIQKRRHRPPDGYDVAIIGAGPAGLASALACQANNLRYVVLEQDEIGGTVLHYPRQKLVLTSPVDLPLYGKLKVSEISKEELLAIWKDIVARFTLNIRTHHKVESVDNRGGTFAITTKGETFTAGSVLLAIGRRGSPRKLGVPGENLSKVMYRLMDAESYTRKHALVVGGGDSAVEAAIGLASQHGNTVTLSYRREDFVRLKEKNEKRIKDFMKSQKVRAIFNSAVLEIKSDNVVIQEAEKILYNIQNDFTFVFAGGELPTELLKRAGVKLRTSEAEALAA
jgi:putative YpdA family bacillithiol system oxidoreductase